MQREAPTLHEPAGAELEPIISKSRFEAFSDGIFAVAATLLVLDVKGVDVAHADVSSAFAAIATLGKPLLAFITSFLVVGIVWLNHHTIFHAVKILDRPTVVLNLVLLLLVALIPLPTALVAAHGDLWPFVALYGFAFALLGLAFGGLFFYVRARFRIFERIEVEARLTRLSDARGMLWPVGYGVGAICAPFATPLSLAIYVAIPIVFLFPSPVERRLDERRRAVDAARDVSPPR